MTNKASDFATYEYMLHLAIKMHKEHFSDYTSWEPENDTHSLLTQIDNMLIALVHRKYKDNLRAVLEGIGCKKIDEVMEQPPEYLEGLGKTTAVYAKVGAMVKHFGAAEVNKMRKEVLNGQKDSPGDAEA